MFNQRKSIWKVITIIAVVIVAVAAFVPTGIVSAASPAGRGGPGSNGQTGTVPSNFGNAGAVRFGQANGTPGAGLALTPLTEAEAVALQEAILEEYGAYNLYRAVLTQFGDVYPFNRIVLSEQQHTAALVRQAEKYGVAVPENPGLVNPPVFSSLAEACQAGVDAEIADAALYDELKLVTTHEDLIRVYNRLQSASLNSHLPEFEACN